MLTKQYSTVIYDHHTLIYSALLFARRHLRFPRRTRSLTVLRSRVTRIRESRSRSEFRLLREARFSLSQAIFYRTNEFLGLTRDTEAAFNGIHSSRRTTDQEDQGSLSAGLFALTSLTRVHFSCQFSLVTSCRAPAAKCARAKQRERSRR